ncbi:chaplin family protein [Streptomyces sp. NPDC054845]
MAAADATAEGAAIDSPGVLSGNRLPLDRHQEVPAPL